MGEFTHPEARSGYTAVGPGWNRELVHAVATVELPTTALQTGDITWLMYVPAGAVIVDGYVKSDDLDTGTSLVFHIGDATTTNLLFSTVTVGTTGGVASMVTTSRYTKFAAATRLKMTALTGAQTAAAGTLIVGLSYFVDPEINVTTGVAPIVIS
jgi:hypothetical protein